MRRLRTLPFLLLAMALPLAPLAAEAGAPGHRIDPNPAFPLPMPEEAGPQEVASPALIDNSRFWNGHRVAFTGEAIGERMRRGDQAWIHLNDDAYMWRNIEEGEPLGGYNTGQAVWLPFSLASRITYFGDYMHEGDVVRVSGTFNAACREHGGDMDIHANALEVVRAGHQVVHVFNRTRAVAATLLLAAAGCLWLVKRRAEKRRI